MTTTQTTTRRPKIKAQGQPAVIISGRMFTGIEAAEFRMRMVGQYRVAYAARLLRRALHSKTLAPRLLKLGNYFDLTTGNRITYCPRGRTQDVNPDTGKWKAEGRQEIKPGRFAALLRMERHAEHITFLFPTVEVKEATTAAEFAAVYADAYHFESCMTSRAEGIAKYYTALGCILLYTEDGEGRPTSRAILWPAVRFDAGEPRPYLDRKYGNHDKRAALAGYAQDKYSAWIKRDDDTHDNENGASLEVIRPDGSVYYADEGEVIPPTNYQPAGELPYLDTFYADSRCDTPTLSNRAGQVEDINGDWIDEDYAVYSNHEGGYIHQDHATCSDVSDDYYRDDDSDLMTIRYRGNYIVFHASELE